MALATWRYLTRQVRPVRRVGRDRVAGTGPDPDRPLPGDGGRIQRRSDGHGPMYRRSYRVQIGRPTLSPEELVEELGRDLNLARIPLRGDLVNRRYGYGSTADPRGHNRMEPPVIGFLIGLLLVGVVAGFLARAIVPGRDSMSLAATILLGIAGSFVGGFLADVLFRSASEDRGLAPSGIIGSIVGAVIVLLIYNALAGRRAAAR